MTPTAERELRVSFAYIHERSPQNALRWLAGINRAIDSLEEFPNRCGIAPESRHLGSTLRHYVFKSHRVIFFADESKKTVRILHVRHGNMRPAGESNSDVD
jgi:plasmid stabilization system protein ParE